MAEYWKSVPSSIGRNCSFRIALLKRMADNPLLRAGVMEMCKRDPIFWINTFVWQHNPSSDVARAGPFVCYPFQRDAVNRIVASIFEKKPLVVEKSRDLGATWLVLMIFVWACLFHRSLDFLVLSKTEEDVESDSAQSLFWKIRYILERLPSWMKGEVKDRGGYLGFVRTRCSIVGRAPTAAAGVGGRFRAIFLDEFQKMQNAQAILEYTTDVGRCRIVVGTHIGVETEFYKLCYGGFFPKIVLHWSMHPEKGAGQYHVDHETKEVTLDPDFEYPESFSPVVNGKPGGPFAGVRSPWYDEEVRSHRASARDVAMNLDIDPLGAQDTFFDTIRIEAYKRKFTRPPVWIGDVHYGPNGQVKSLVENGLGSLRLWLYPKPDGTAPLAHYGFACDIAAGVGNSPSTASGANIKTGEKIAEFSSSHILPTAFAELMVGLCRLFKSETGETACLNWETNGGQGSSFSIRVRELSFGNVYRKEGFDFKYSVTDGEPGVYMGAQVKLAILSEYRDALWLEKFINRSERAIEECHSYKYTAKGPAHAKQEAKGTAASAARENHGDLVVADALLWWMIRNRIALIEDEKAKSTPPLLSRRQRMAEAGQSRVDSWFPMR